MPEVNFHCERFSEPMSACDNVKYRFEFNESDRAIQVTYWFSTAIPDEAASVIDFEPHAHTMRYGPPKHRGRKPTLDAIFDDPKKLRELTKQSEALFAEGLGGAIDIAIQLLVHSTMYRCGVVAWRDTSKLMADLFAKTFRTDLAKQLKVKTGPRSRFKDADDYRRELLECMKSALTEGEIPSARQFTQEKAAERLAKKFKDEGKFDVRTIRQWNTDYDVKWRKFVNESWTEVSNETKDVCDDATRSKNKKPKSSH
jgi:hypothetical protein